MHSVLNRLATMTLLAVVFGCKLGWTASEAKLDDNVAVDLADLDKKLAPQQLDRICRGHSLFIFAGNGEPMGQSVFPALAAADVEKDRLAHDLYHGVFVDRIKIGLAALDTALNDNPCKEWQKSHNEPVHLTLASIFDGPSVQDSEIRISYRTWLPGVPEVHSKDVRASWKDGKFATRTDDATTFELNMGVDLPSVIKRISTGDFVVDLNDALVDLTDDDRARLQDFGLVSLYIKSHGSSLEEGNRHANMILFDMHGPETTLENGEYKGLLLSKLFDHEWSETALLQICKDFSKSADDRLKAFCLARYPADGALVDGVAAGTEEALARASAFSGRTDSGRTDSGRTDSGRTDSGRTDSGRTDSGRTDSGRTDSGRTDSGRTDSGRTDSGRTDSGRTDSGKPDSLEKFGEIADDLGFSFGWLRAQPNNATAEVDYRKPQGYFQAGEAATYNLDDLAGIEGINAFTLELPDSSRGDLVYVMLDSCEQSSDLAKILTRAIRRADAVPAVMMWTTSAFFFHAIQYDKLNALQYLALPHIMWWGGPALSQDPLDTSMRTDTVRSMALSIAKHLHDDGLDRALVQRAFPNLVIKPKNSKLEAQVCLGLQCAVVAPSTETK